MIEIIAIVIIMIIILSERVDFLNFPAVKMEFAQCRKVFGKM